MGYTTLFVGKFKLDRPLNPEHQTFLRKFIESDYSKSSNVPPKSNCQWIPSDDGEWIEWDGVGKFYYYVEWLYYIVEHFLQPWGYTLNGEIAWQGEEVDDYGVIIVKDNEINDDAQGHSTKYLTRSQLIEVVRQTVFYYYNGFSDKEGRKYALIDRLGYFSQSSPIVKAFAWINGNRVVVNFDTDEKPLVDAFIQAGIPREQIVLAYAGEK